MQNRIILSTGLIALTLSVGAQAQQQPAATTPTTAGGLSSSLGVYVFPAKNQTAEKQSTDEASCFGWAKSQTGIDPMAIKPQTQPASQQTPPPEQAGSGARTRGAVRGAAGGAAIGAIAGDAGTGAAAGAVAGTMAGGAQKRQAQQQAAAQQQQQQQAAAQQAQASVAEQKATYNKAFSACMEGKGYTVK
jgi:hypothetical protein